MSIKPARIRATVVAILVLTFVIPWTYAHIAHSWDRKEQSTGETRTGRYYPISYDRQRSIRLGTIPDGRFVYIGISGKISMGRQIGFFGLSARNDNDYFNFLGGAEGLYLGDTTIVEGASTFTLKGAYPGIVWFIPNSGKATFCSSPDPILVFRDFP